MAFYVLVAKGKSGDSPRQIHGCSQCGNPCVRLDEQTGVRFRGPETRVPSDDVLGPFSTVSWWKKAWTFPRRHRHRSPSQGESFIVRFRLQDVSCWPDEIWVHSWPQGYRDVLKARPWKEPGRVNLLHYHNLRDEMPYSHCANVEVNRICRRNATRMVERMDFSPGARAKPAHPHLNISWYLQMLFKSIAHPLREKRLS